MPPATAIEGEPKDPESADLLEGHRRRVPEPCPFLSRKLPPCSIIRPTATKGIAMGVVNFLTNMGLFKGQSSDFAKVMRELAADADRARREF